MPRTGRRRLTRVAATGVPGLPDLELDLGSVTALVGPRGSGKSQLLGSVAWLLTGRPEIAPAGARIRVSGGFAGDGGVVQALRTGASGGRLQSASPEMLPACSFLQARDRFAPSFGAGGSVESRVGELVGRPTSDAAAAEALVAAVAACCDECVTGEVLLIEEPELLLTPQAQRYLYRLLRRFADAENQVLYSTRSPAFLDAAHHDEIGAAAQV